MGSKLDRITSIALTLTALAIGSSVVYRTFAQGTSTTGAVKAATKFDDWRALDSVGYVLSGGPDSPIHITVFSDLECPACRAFHRNISEAMTTYPNKVKLVYLSLPLSYHKFATPSARATHCVSQLGGDLLKWFSTVFEKQDSLGLKSWGSFAHEAGVSDSVRIQQCASSGDPGAIAAVSMFTKWSDRVGVAGTPTVLINGVVFGSPPSRAKLDTILSRASAP